MNTKSIVFTAGMAWLTMLTLGGSTWSFLFLTIPNSITQLDVIRSDNVVLQLIAALAVYLCAGGLWGVGIARLMDADVKSMMKICALSWTATGLTFTIALGLSLGPIFKFGATLPNCCHSTHYYFLSIFVPVISIVTAINGYVVTRKLGFKELQKSGAMYAGLAAAVGFLTVGLILLYGPGWEVGKPVPGKYEMLLLMEFCSVGAALAGGAVLGRVLERSRRNERRNSP